MKAVVFHDVGDIRLEDVPEPRIREPQDAIVRITTSAICGTDLHAVRGTVPGMVPGTVLGHEAVAVVEEVGPDVHSLFPGDRVVVPSTIACGYCSYCREAYYAQCDNANPNGHLAGTAYYGGPRDSGPFDGLQAEYARVPFAPINLVKLPDEVSDDAAILLSDVFPTGYFGAEMAHVRPGRTVAVFGCGPVGQFAITSAFLRNAGRVFAVDTVPSRLEMAECQGAEVIDYNKVDPVEAIRHLTGDIGVDRAIDAVGVDANAPTSGPAAKQAQALRPRFDEEVREVAPRQNPRNGNWLPGNAPSQALRWALDSLAKAGTLSIVGVYPPTMRQFLIGQAMSKNLAVNMGNCHHRRYIPRLLEIVRAGQIRPELLLTQQRPLADAIDAYRRFDRREAGWTKVALRHQVQQALKAA